jgi:hypothetical protein
VRFRSRSCGEPSSDLPEQHRPNAAHGLLINAAEVGRAGAALPQRANHIDIDNVLFENIGSRDWGGRKLFRVFGGLADVSITHVTSSSNPSGILDPGGPDDTNPRLVYLRRVRPGD